MSSLSDVILSLERQNESSSSQMTSFSKLVSGIWSSSSMYKMICFLSSLNSACRFAWKHEASYLWYVCHVKLEQLIT